MKKLVLLMMVFGVSFSAMGESQYVDSAKLMECRGRVELRESEDNLHLIFKNVKNCDRLTVRNIYGRLIVNYDMKSRFDKKAVTKSYTLTKDMWKQLRNGELLLTIEGRWAEDRVTLKVYETSRNKNVQVKKPHDPLKCGGHSSYNYTGYALTSSCRCGFYRQGEYKYLAVGLEALACLLL